MTSPLANLQPDAVARLESLLAKAWSLGEGHPLAALQGAALGEGRLLVLLGPKNNVGSRYFQLFLTDGAGRLTEEPLAFGLYNSGPYPGYNWIELTRYTPPAEFAGSPETALFLKLSGLVPAGGHLMVEYDSPAQKATERILTLGFPPVTSPIGLRLFQAGCRSYRDWYISEGGREGPRKLQGFKPLNKDIEREKTQQLRAEVEAVLAGDAAAHGKWGEIARRNAAAVLQTLGG